MGQGRFEPTYSYTSLSEVPDREKSGRTRFCYVKDRAIPIFRAAAPVAAAIILVDQVTRSLFPWI
jgi:hypothetical protein